MAKRDSDQSYEGPSWKRFKTDDITDVSIVEASSGSSNRLIICLDAQNSNSEENDSLDDANHKTPVAEASSDIASVVCEKTTVEAKAIRRDFGGDFSTPTNTRSPFSVRWSKETAIPSDGKLAMHVPSTCGVHFTCIVPLGLVAMYSSQDPLRFKHMTPSGLKERWPSLYNHWTEMVKAERKYPMIDNVLEYHPSLEDWTRLPYIVGFAKVANIMKCSKETFHLAVDYFDRYLMAARDLVESDLQRLSAVAFYQAMKMEDPSKPGIKAFLEIYFGDLETCTISDFKKRQIDFLTVLDFQLNPVTINAWLAFFLQVGKLDKNSSEAKTPLTDVQISNWVLHQVSRISDLFLTDALCHRFTYRVIAASAIYFASKSAKFTLSVTGLSWNKIAYCVKWLQPFSCVAMRHECQITKHTTGQSQDNYHIQCDNISCDMLHSALLCTDDDNISTVDPLTHWELSPVEACIFTHQSQMDIKGT